MKIIAHSETPVSLTPYMHLGYAAAVPMNQSLHGCMGLAVAWFLGYQFLMKRPRTSLNRIVGVSCYAIGICALFAGLHSARISSRELSARRVLYNIDTRILQRIGNGHDVSATDIRSLQRELGLGDDDIRDPWSRELRFTRFTLDGQQRYLLRSMGQDGKFNTDDDVTFSGPLESGKILP